MASDAQESIPWYRSAFGDDYPLIYGHRDEDEARRQIEQIRHWLKWRPGDRALDICCGGGRHLSLLRDQGLEAWGVDLSPQLLGQAAGRPGLAGRLVRADVRCLPFQSCFDVAINLFTSFGYFDDPEDDRRQLRGMIGVLRPGGKLVLDVVNSEYLRRRFEEYSERETEGFQIRETRWLENGRVFKTIELKGTDGSRRVFREAVRLYDAGQLIQLFSTHGMKIVQHHGDFSQTPPGPDAPRQILIGVRS